MVYFDTNDISIHNFNANEIRVVTNEGTPWFVASDVARVLGLANISVTLKSKYISADERTKNFLGGRWLLTISESALYKLVLRSIKPEAREFQDWVTRTVLPTLRKEGM